MKLRILLALLFACLVASAQPNCALTSVRCAGSAQEYATLQLAANAAIAGDTVYAFNDVTTGFAITTGHVSGTANSPITFLAQAGGNITVAGNGSGDGVNINDVNHVIIDGFTITGMGRVGIKIALCDGCLTIRNHVTNSHDQNILYGFVTGTVPGTCGIDYNEVSGAVLQHGIYFSNSNKGFDGCHIVGNYSHDNGGNGIQINGDCTTLDPSNFSDGILSGMYIAANHTKNNVAHGLQIINMHSSTVAANLFESDGVSSEMAFADQGCGYGSNNNVIVNNTFWTTGTAIRIITTTPGASTGNTFFNNLIVATGFKCVTDDGVNSTNCDNAGSGSTGNNYQVGREYTTSTATGVFTNQAAGDYTLAVSSPAIGAGVSSYLGYSAPLLDLSGNLRPVSTWDVGAYEFGGSAAGTDTTAPTTPGTVAPTPTAYQIGLTWPVSTDAQGVIGYAVYRNAVPYASALQNSYTDTSVVPGTSYTYAVYAYDPSGNFSAASSIGSTAYGQALCLNADTTFRSALVPRRSGTETYEWDSKPFGTPQSVMYLSNLAPTTTTTFSAMAVIVAFMSGGTVQARNGSSYTADITLNWSTSVSYHFRLVVRIASHTYDVYVTPSSGGGELTLATNYAFRTEQNTVTSLGFIGANDSGGATSVCAPSLNGVAISTNSYFQKSTQDLASQTTTAALTDANGTGKPLLDRPDGPTLTASRALTADDNAKILPYSGSSPITVTVPTGLGVNFGCTIVQEGSGVVTISGSGLTLTPAGPTHTRGVGSPAVVQCTAADVCHLWGDVQ